MSSQPKTGKAAACKVPRVPEMEALETCVIKHTKPWSDKRACLIESRAVHDALTRERYRLLGHGAHRRVFALNGCVIKVAHDARGAEANAAESDAWENLKRMRNADLLKMFVPIASAHPDGAWLIQPRVEPIDNDEYHARDIAIEIQDELLDIGAACPDVHEDNIGWLKGRPVILDYGFGVACKLTEADKRHYREDIERRRGDD